MALRDKTRNFFRQLFLNVQNSRYLYQNKLFLVLHITIMVEIESQYNDCI